MIKKIHSFFAMLYGFYIIGLRSFVVMIRSVFRKVDRAFVNQSMRRGSITLLKTVKARYSIQMGENVKILENLPRIYMSNHASLFDLPLIMATMPGSVRLVVKKELSYIPLFGTALKQTEQLLVDRKHPEKMAAFFEDAKRKLASGISLWIFPEGTRSKTGELLPFKIGGFRLAREVGAQIIPVGIQGTRAIIPLGKLAPAFDQTITIRVGQPIDCRDYPLLEQQKILIQKTSDAILHLMNP